MELHDKLFLSTRAISDTEWNQILDILPAILSELSSNYFPGKRIFLFPPRCGKEQEVKANASYFMMNFYFWQQKASGVFSLLLMTHMLTTATSLEPLEQGLGVLAIQKNPAFIHTQEQQSLDGLMEKWTE